MRSCGGVQTQAPAIKAWGHLTNSDNLAWYYVIREGVVWKVEEAPAGYEPESKDELIV